LLHENHQMPGLCDPVSRPQMQMSRRRRALTHHLVLAVAATSKGAAVSATARRRLRVKSATWASAAVGPLEAVSAADDCFNQPDVAGLTTEQRHFRGVETDVQVRQPRTAGSETSWPRQKRAKHVEQPGSGLLCG
jgi:hypothetical protein